GGRTRQTRVDADRAAEQRQSAVHARVGAGDAWNGQRDVFDAAHVLSRIIEVEHPLWDFDVADTRGLELQELKWEPQAQRKVFRELVFAHVEVAVRLFHRTECELQSLTGEESLMQAIPRLTRQEMPRRVASFKVEGTLGLLCGLPRQFPHPV